MFSENNDYYDETVEQTKTNKIELTDKVRNMEIDLRHLLSPSRLKYIHRESMPLHACNNNLVPITIQRVSHQLTKQRALVQTNNVLLKQMT